jgi:hypothetical protein
VNQVVVQGKPNDLCIGPMTRAHAKVLEQKVNSLLADFDIFINESFILPKSLLLFMIRFEVEDSMAHGEEMHKDHCGLSSIVKVHEGGQGRGRNTIEYERQLEVRLALGQPEKFFKSRHQGDQVISWRTMNYYICKMHQELWLRPGSQAELPTPFLGRFVIGPS